MNELFIVEGGDQLASNLVILLIPICLMDPRKNQWSPKKQLNLNYVGELFLLIVLSFYIVIKIQVCAVYLNSSIAKFGVEEWANGTATYYWFTNPLFGASGSVASIIIPIVKTKIGVTVTTWGTILLELFLGMGLFMKKEYKRIALIIGILFHLGIIVFLGLVSFYFSMMGALVLYLANLEKDSTLFISPSKLIRSLSKSE
jgi:antimicrobial peptide system SdpB family protein